MDPKNGVHDGKEWFIVINSFPTGPVIVLNGKLQLHFEILLLYARESRLPFGLGYTELCWWHQMSHETFFYASHWLS